MNVKNKVNNIFKSLKKSKIDYFQCVSSSCVYRDSGPSRISEKMRLTGCTIRHALIVIT